MTTFKPFPRNADDIDAANVGLALSGLVVREASGQPRVGMMSPGPAATAVPASWKVEVGPFIYAHQVAGALQLSGVSAAEQLDILPATGNIPAGQARLDLVCWDPIAAELSVVRGTPAASPVEPPVGTLAKVLKVRVNAGDGMVLPDRVTKEYQFADRVQGKITTVAAGVTVSAQTRIERDPSGMVDVYVELISPAAMGTNLWIATMPLGFRPAATTEFVGGASQGGAAGPVFGEVRANGGIYVWNPPAGNRKLSFHTRYLAVL
ncbi:hypothetical protein [Leucobacter ruminantium]|uniref:Uncharacterized protein n=1 Tax=Leucobacter ruminantium TaxID=1289170 RepID=A0A939LZ91_9MICO|nr:hypothetical protein [Leucobacter ruminantium]MBO1805833.1 hypothetical protein [Leucobacter ruminantium]